MVETRAARRARESESIVADKLVIVVPSVLNLPPLISWGICIISVQPDLAHAEEYLARTYSRRSNRQSSGKAGKVRIIQPPL